MIWKDGEFEIYMIQHDYHADGNYSYSNFDSFGHPEGFTASDPCWQTTGVMGTFDWETAQSGLEWIRRQHSATRFRLVLVRIKQTTEVARV